MNFRKLLIGAAIASSLGAIALPVQAEVDVYLNFGPPAVRYERVPPPRAGYVWAPGYWNYNGYRHVWASGHWVRQRAGYVYYAPQWRYYDGHYHLRRESWQPNRYDRDRDNDGVPNRYDSNPNNPYRR